MLFVMSVGLVWTGCGDDDDDMPEPTGGATQITLLQFSAPFQAVGTIDEANKQIIVPVPFAADVSGVTGSVTVSDGATVSPDLTSPVDFSGGPVTFTVTSGDNTSNYTVEIEEGANPLRLVMVGDAADMDGLDAEMRTAYEWGMNEYQTKAAYVSFADLDMDELDPASVVWYHYTTFPRPDVDAGEEIFPQSALDKRDAIASFAKAGGNLLLSGLAGSYVAEIGRVDEEFGPTNFDIGGDEFIENPDNWGISFIPGVFQETDYPEGNAQYFLFNDLNTAEVTFEGVTYNAIFLSDGGAKKNRAHIWDFNRFYGESIPGGCDDPNAKKTQFESDTNSKVRASFEWDPAACGVELGAIVEFEPAGDFQGTALVIGLGAYEWNLLDGRTNQWQANVEGITKNALDRFIVD